MCQKYTVERWETKAASEEAQGNGGKRRHLPYGFKFGVLHLLIRSRMCERNPCMGIKFVLFRSDYR